MTTQLSDYLKELITKARIVSFTNWQDSYPPEIIQHFQAADDHGRYLSDDDLQQIKASSPDTEPLINTAKFLRDNASDIVSEARETVLAQYPDITKPGGSLYPAPRAEACWRDFWHFLRCITYGIAGSSTEFTSAEGLHYMNLLYKEMQVPIPAMVSGLEQIKAASLKRLSEPETIADYFDHLINKLKQFS
ncbi:MAG: phycobilisome protein [Moorea sp. SIO3I6]|nr:phycobilisome protein [Moorena sp. SIO3I6]NEP20926.1 phycobilisome protein [Moorena sp. SIO3I6]